MRYPCRASSSLSHAPCTSPSAAWCSTCTATAPLRKSRTTSMTRSAGRLEQLDQIAGRIAKQHLCSPGPADDRVAGLESLRGQPVDLGGQVVDDEVDAVPPAG